MAVRADTTGPEQSSEEGSRQKSQEKSGPFWERGDWPKILPDTVLDHPNFHRDNARYSQRIARLLDGGIIVLSAAIPVMAAARVHQAVIGGLGASVTVLAALGHQFNWKDNWIRQNRVIMAIQQELVWYRNGQPPYDGSASEADQRKLALRVENVVQADAETWADRLEQDKKEKEQEGDRNGTLTKTGRPPA
jgi:hypothetical protein